MHSKSKFHPHVGDAELHALGHELLAMFNGKPEHRPTTFLTVREQRERHYDTCPICAYDRVPGGHFSLIHDYKDHRVEEMPYLVVHVLAAHGTVAPREQLGDVGQLRKLLNQSERALAVRVVGLTSGANPASGVGFMHEPVKGWHTCDHCDDPLNLGAVILSGGADRFELGYLALHTLYEHGDIRWADTEGKTGKIDLDALRMLIDSGNDLVDLGDRLASILPFLGGTATPPAGLIVNEDPLRGIESCQHCSERPNMGTFTLIHTQLQRQLTLPYIAVHALQKHGSAHYAGNLHQGVVDVRLLARMLKLS